MKSSILLACLAASFASYGQSRYRVPPANCVSASAECLAQNFTATGKLTLSGTTGPQVDSTGASPFELRSRATGANDAFRLYAHNDVSGNLLVVSEKAGTTAEERMTVNQIGQLRLYPNGVSGGGIELFGSIDQTNGGGDAPLVLKGGVASTATTSRLVSIQSGLGVQKLGIRSDGAIDFAGTPTASLDPCGASDKLLQFDTTTSTLKYCNGSSYINVAGSVETASSFSDLTSATETVFGSHKVQFSGTAQTLSFVSQIPGVNGAGTGTAILEIINEAGGVLCTLGSFACNAAAGTITTASCTGGGTQPVAANSVRFQWDTTSDCTTLPKGNADVSWR